MNIDTINYVIALVGLLIVFTALTVLYLIFAAVPKILNMHINFAFRKAGNPQNNIKESTISGDENAAIAAAIYLYFNELHDTENTTMTIKRVHKIYSPWSSKLHGLNILRR